MSAPGGLALEVREGLPDALRFLVEQYPRDIWEAHENFDGLTRFWLQRHMEFRRALSLIQSETEAGLDGQRSGPDAVRRAAGVTGFLVEALHGHHQIEDHHYFPIFLEAEPRLSKGFDLLDADHEALNAHLYDAAASARHLSEAMAAGGDLRPALEAHRKLSLSFERFLNRHLLDEEDLIVPIVLEHAPRTG